MKNLLIFFALPVMILAGAVSCTKNGNEEIEVPTVKSEITLDTSAVDVSAKAGTYSIGYRIDTLVGGAAVEALSRDTWVNTFVYDTVSCTISFNVDENTGADRETQVSVVYPNAEEPAVFTVKQPNAAKVFASELDNTRWEAAYCRFHRDSTIFNEVNPEIQSELWYIKITAGEFADQYAMDWNMANPDNLITSDYALAFEFIETPELTTFYRVLFYDGYVEISDGMATPAGSGELLRVYGEYEFDESTGLLKVHDISNQLYEREVIYKITRDGDHLNFRCTYMWWPENLEYYFGDDDRFGLVIYNYDGSQCYLPFGYLRYELYPMPEDEVIE